MNAIHTARKARLANIKIPISSKRNPSASSAKGARTSDSTAMKITAAGFTRADSNSTCAPMRSRRRRRRLSEGKNPAKLRLESAERVEFASEESALICFRKAERRWIEALSPFCAAAKSDKFGRSFTGLPRASAAACRKAIMRAAAFGSPAMACRLVAKISLMTDGKLARFDGGPERAEPLAGWDEVHICASIC